MRSLCIALHDQKDIDDCVEEYERAGFTAMKIIGVGALGLMLVGCAAMTELTPKQEQGYARAKECSDATGYTANITVQPDGRMRGGEGRLDLQNAWKSCMTQRFGYRWQ